VNCYKYLVADSRNLVQVFAEQHLDKADLVLTSPPYYDTKFYDEPNHQIGYKQSYQDYLADTVGILQQCYDVTNDNATLWLVTDTVKRNGMLYPIPFDINSKLGEIDSNKYSRSKSWILRDVIIWNRSKNLPWHSRGRLKHEFEYILFYSKNDEYKYYLDKLRNIDDYKKWWLTYPERYNPKGRPPSNVWEFSIPIRGWGNSYQKHLCPFPFPLIERILTISSDCNDVILDPFAGSGSVIALAYYMERIAIGLDISNSYKDQFEKEVLIGAKGYWLAREKELQETCSKLQLFENTNLKLRKIKAGLQLYTFIKDKSEPRNSIFFLLDIPIQEHSIDFVIAQCSSNCSLDTSVLSTFVEKLNGKYRMNIFVKFKDLDELVDSQLHNRTLYVYSTQSIYRYQNKLTVNKIPPNSFDSDYLFSDIEIDIENPIEFFGKDNE
jgi:DNA modification methylase